MATQAPPQTAMPATAPGSRFGVGTHTAPVSGSLASRDGVTQVSPGLGSALVVSGSDSSRTGNEGTGATNRQSSVEGRFEPLVLSPACARMPVALSVLVPVRDFRVRQLLAMAPGAVIKTSWSNGEDLPLTSGDVQLAWTEFEVVQTQLSVRITRLA